jgi:hypothetical protein
MRVRIPDKVGSTHCHFLSDKRLIAIGTGPLHNETFNLAIDLGDFSRIAYDEGKGIPRHRVPQITRARAFHLGQEIPGLLGDWCQGSRHAQTRPAAFEAMASRSNCAPNSLPKPTVSSRRK